MARTTGWNVMVDFLACRTAYFDEMVTKAAQPGVRQFVIICAGLDSRAWRLNWPDSSTVYEMDQPSVLRFKSDGLGRSEAQTLCEYLEVGIDLRMDWPNTLQATVFKAAEPTAWIAEGLMPYLPAAAQDSLFDHILQLSALGCWIGVEALPVDVPHSEHYALAAAANNPRRRPTIRPTFRRSANCSTSRNGLNLQTWLEEKGWQLSVIHAQALVRQFDRANSPSAAELIPPKRFMTAHLAV
jgi:methyltransferase (TIGR00027 family)